MFMIIDGKPEDLTYQRLGTEGFVYRVMVGDLYIGQVHKIHPYWSCFCSEPHPFGVVSGFHTRTDAAMFLSRLHPTTTDVRENK